MMKKIINILACFLIIGSFAVFAQAQKEWLGNYSFDEDGGKTAGGSAIFVSHEINIVESDDGLIATIQSNGFQTSKDLICTTKIEGDKLLVYFDGYGENNVFENYEKGDLLLTLQRKNGKSGAEILTFWGKFQPIVPKNEKTGKVYFRKSAKE